MGQRSSYAGRKDAQVKLEVEACASGMGQRPQTKRKYATRMDALIKL